MKELTNTITATDRPRCAGGEKTSPAFSIVIIYFNLGILLLLLLLLFYVHINSLIYFAFCSLVILRHCYSSSLRPMLARDWVMLQESDADGCGLGEAGQRLSAHQDEYRSVIYKPSNDANTHYAGNSVVISLTHTVGGSVV